ncbi:MAG: methyltransferase domain-containing protein [bacterium]
MREPTVDVDWSSGHYRRIITDQRRWLFNWDWLDWVFREHLEIGRARAALDAGCGAGFLAFEMARLNPELRVRGVDTSDALLASAREECESRGLVGRVAFERGDCYSLGCGDGAFDIAGCSTVLLHLTEPGKAVAEMARATAPGGIVFAIEPDNFASFPAGWDSACESDEVDYGWAARKFEYAATLYRGKIAAGQGDSAVARRMPAFFTDAGLDVFFFRKSDRMLALIPPYDTEEKLALADNLRITLSEEQCRKFLPQLKSEYVAGGGTEAGFDAFWDERIARQNKALEALAAGTLTWVGNHTVCICAGRKS